MSMFSRLLQGPYDRTNWRDEQGENRELQAQIKQMKETEHRLRTECNILSGRLDKCEEVYEHRENEWKRYLGDIIAQHEREQETTRRQIAIIEEENKKQLSALKLQNDHVVTMLQTRSEELNNAQLFLAKNDTLSDGDIVREVTHINAEIYQVAAQISEAYPFHRAHDHVDIDPERRDMVNQLVGSEMTHLLTSTHQNNVAIVVQIALQACMAARICMIVTSWGARSTTIDKVYRAMRDGEESYIIARRWGALARRYIRTVYGEVDECARYTSSLTKALSAVLALNQKKTEYNSTRDSLNRDFGERISAMVECAIEIRKAVGEELISVEITPYVTQGDKFNPDRMEDAYGNEQKSGQPLTEQEGQDAIRVLCTTGLGLLRTSARTVTVLLKSQVVLGTLKKDLL